MGMITSHQSLKQSAIKILDQILSMFIQTQVRMVANWLAGQLAQTMATTTSQTAQTAAVTAGASWALSALLLAMTRVPLLVVQRNAQFACAAALCASAVVLLARHDRFELGWMR